MEIERKKNSFLFYILLKLDIVDRTLVFLYYLYIYVFSEKRLLKKRKELHFVYFFSSSRCSFHVVLCYDGHKEISCVTMLLL